MRKHRVGFVALALGVAILAGCGDDEPSGPAYASFTGEWRGSLSGISVRIYVEDDDGDITGNGTLQAAQTISITVDGDHDHPDVSFTGRSPGFESFEFDGRFIHADTVSGRASGSGFTNDLLRLARQP